MLDQLDRFFSCPDLGRLIARISLAFLMLPHGIVKLPFFHGLVNVQATLTEAGLPISLAILAPIFEILAPLMLVIGWRVRVASIIVIGTMLFALAATVGFNLFALDAVGGFKGEKALMYISLALVVLFLGAGKYSIDKK